MATTEGGLPDRCWAFVPSEARGTDGTKSARKLRLCDIESERFDCAIIGAAAAAFSPGGFRGNRVELPANAVAAAKRRIRSARAAARCEGELPESVRP